MIKEQFETLGQEHRPGIFFFTPLLDLSFFCKYLKLYLAVASFLSSKPKKKLLTPTVFGIRLLIGLKFT